MYLLSIRGIFNPGGEISYNGLERIASYASIHRTCSVTIIITA